MTPPATEPPVVDDRDPFDEFNRAMGATGRTTPYPEFAEVRRQAPIIGGALGLTVDDADGPFSNLPEMYTAYSFEAVHHILGDGVTFSSTGYAEVMGKVMGHSILEMDEPEHHAYRSIIQQAFTRKSMARWETELVGPIVDRIIDGFVDDGRVDLVRTLLFPFPVTVIAALLGLPEEDLPTFHRLAVELIGVSVDWDRAVRASAAFGEYFASILDHRRSHPSDDMISVLATAERDGQRLSDEEIFAFLRLLLPAGAETTYRSSSNLLYGLLSHPDQLRAVTEDRVLLPQAIEEGLRWEPPLLLILRTATRDTEVCGVPVPEGAVVIVSLGSANHDEARWDEPERFDISRVRKPHIGFAHGPHMCLGMHLARMETQVVVNALLNRLPGLRFAPGTADDHHISGMTFRAPPFLDVVWD